MQPNELFRYVALRAPRPRRPRIDLGLTTRATLFSRRLLDDLSAAEPRRRVNATVAAFLASPEFPARPREQHSLALLDDLYRRVQRERPRDASAALVLVAAQLGVAPAAFLRARETQAARELTRDGIVALKLAANPPAGLLASLTRIYQTLHFVERLVSGPDEIDFSSPSRMLALPIRFPKELAILPAPRAGAESLTVDAPLAADLAAAERLNQLDLAIVEVTSQATAFTRRDPSADGARGAIVLAASARNRLSAATRATLSAEAIDLAETDFRAALDTLEGARVVALNTLTAREASGDNHARLALDTLILSDPGTAPLIPTGVDFLDPSTRPPTTVGPIEPSSVGQLLVTRQQIKRYEAGEISHVENVLQSESRSRSTRRLTRVEESFSTEQETTEEEERDLQTTERLELQSEIEKTIADSRAFEVGGSVSAGYGPFVQVEAHASYETESSTEQTENRASEFAKEMSERAAKKVTQRALTKQTRTTIEEFEENNSHGFNNTAGAGNITGIYQWLDRVYELQVYDVGVRVIFEFTVPEPAALYLRALDFKSGRSERPRRPSPLTVRPKDINANNYDRLAARYQAEGVTPPPPDRITVGHAFAHASADGRPTSHAAFEVVKVKPGYSAVMARAEINTNRLSTSALPPAFGDGEGDGFTPPDFNRVDLLIADRRMFMRRGDDGTTSSLEDTLDNLDNEISIAVTAENIVAFAATISIECLRQPSAYEEWQVKTYEALAAAYRARLSDYKNDKATLAAQQASQPSGRNPTQNRIIEQNEIKRLAIMMLSGQRFHSTSVPLSPQAAEFDFDRALATGNYAKFWETSHGLAQSELRVSSLLLGRPVDVGPHADRGRRPAARAVPVGGCGDHPARGDSGFRGAAAALPRDRQHLDRRRAARGDARRLHRVSRRDRGAPARAARSEPAARRRALRGGCGRSALGTPPADHTGGAPSRRQPAALGEE